ncbi:hypothetical protein U1Q18_046712, partial [Sarracenia purpurea var. burkii]
MEAGVFWSLLMIFSFLFQAADTVLKEIIFLNASQQLKGRSVDLFVVNSYGSAFQALLYASCYRFAKVMGHPILSTAKLYQRWGGLLPKHWHCFK